jgi:hypothetical protein
MRQKRVSLLHVNIDPVFGRRYHVDVGYGSDVSANFVSNSHDFELGYSKNRRNVGNAANMLTVVTTKNKTNVITELP